ncbi:MAG TPA: Dabb family protein [Candidatus Nitrosotalea sp.]|nr:Dabb family protein [Candidatus Nitrosotalea sp.]
MTAMHIAWFRFKEGTDEKRIAHHVAAVRSLAHLVPEALSVECSASYTDRAGGLTHCIVVTLPDRGALPRYLEHPDHVPIADALVADVAELRVMDLDLAVL